MVLLLYIVTFTFLGMLISCMSIALLCLKSNVIKRFSHFLLSFTIGTLLGVVFFDILPEAFALNNNYPLLFSLVMGGIIFFLFLERIIGYYHHHEEHLLDHAPAGKTTTILILLSDGVHNFLDGIIITLSFLTSIPLGIATSLAVIFHEIPQQIGSGALLLINGVSPKNVLTYNILASSTIVIGGISAYAFAHLLEPIIPYCLALIAGNFIYIALSDLVPEVHEHDVGLLETISHFILILLGIISIILL